LDFSSCWIVFIYFIHVLQGGVPVVCSSYPRGAVKILAFAQCSRTGRNAMLGQIVSNG